MHIEGGSASASHGQPLAQIARADHPWILHKHAARLAPRRHSFAALRYIASARSASGNGRAHRLFVITAAGRVLTAFDTPWAQSEADHSPCSALRDRART